MLSSLSIQLLESPDFATFPGAKTSFGPGHPEAVTFGVMEGKMGALRNDQGEIAKMTRLVTSVTDTAHFFIGTDGPEDNIYTTHSQLAAAMDPYFFQELKELYEECLEIAKLPPIDQDVSEDLEDRVNQWLDLRNAFDVAGRSWLVGNLLLVSFWEVAPSPPLLDKVLAFVRKQYGGEADKAEIWMQDDNLADYDWVQPNVSVEQLDPESLKRIKTLSALLHTATPEQKARIRAEIQQLRGSAPELPAWGSSLQAKRAQKAGFGHFAAMRSATPPR